MSEPTAQDSLGLNLDMLDVDRMREWARNLETYGPDVTHWASLPFLIERLRAWADNLDTTIRDIGVLRAHAAGLREQVDAQTKALAECYRLSGADPDGDDDTMLAQHAVRAVKELREDSDAENEQLQQRADALAATLAAVRSLCTRSRQYDHIGSVSEFFLATDVLALIDAPDPPAAVSASQEPRDTR